MDNADAPIFNAFAPDSALLSATIGLYSKGLRKLRHSDRIRALEFSDFRMHEH